MSEQDTERGEALRAISEAVVSVADAVLDRGLTLDEAVAAFETRLAKQALSRHGGNLSQAALALGVHRNTLRQKLQRNGARPQRGK
ncbi:MAG: helix-turn-helix domain-containing protein [Thermoanaerobaculaceae bacterium]|nr:helix-turn-helix domain-containing protein [Thermoanaerobaculaceae bacterium]